MQDKYSTQIESRKRQCCKAPRYSWEHYGITKKRREKLKAVIQSGKYSDIARLAAYTASSDIAEYILLSVMENKSYESVEYIKGIGRIPCGRTDFYGYRRLFYHLFDERIRKDGR